MDVSGCQQTSADVSGFGNENADISGCQYFRKVAFYIVFCTMGENSDFSGSIYQRYINQRIRYSGPHQSADPMHGPESIDGFHAETSVSGVDKQAPVNRQA